jgi:EmrB/QacA subfamily drug resistance transporter
MVEQMRNSEKADSKNLEPSQVGELSAAGTTVDNQDEKLAPGTTMALVAVSMAIFAMALDFTALSVALPKMQMDFGVDVATIQWVINAYAIVIGVLIVTGGRVADMFGRRKVFLISSFAFAFFSLVAGIATHEGLLIFGRAAMGIGGAVMWPAALGMTYAILPKSKAGLAGGLIIGVAGLGNACGPILGGTFTDLLSWRWVFFINIPIAIITCLIISRKVKADPPQKSHERIDYLGIVTFSIGVVALLLALTQVTDLGWGDPLVIGLLCLCPVMLVIFAVVEKRIGSHALLPPDVLKNKQFRAACLAILLFSAVFFTALLYIPLFMVNVLGYSPLQAGLGMLPWMAGFAVVSFISGNLYKRLGAKLIISLGGLALCVAPFLFSLIGGNSGYSELLPGMLCMGIGVGMFYSSTTTAAVTALDSSRSSLASGVLYMFQIVGGTVGLGVATTVFSAVSQNHLNSIDSVEGVGPAQKELLGKVLDGSDSPQALADQDAPFLLHNLFAEAFTSGMQVVYLAVGIFAFLGFITALLFVGGRLRFTRGESGKVKLAIEEPAEAETEADEFVMTVSEDESTPETTESISSTGTRGSQ